MAHLYHWFTSMSFSARVIALRKQKGMTQQGLADASSIHVQQIKRYEAGYAQPTAEALKKLTVALHVTADFLLFEDGERGPDEELRLQFEAVAAMQPQEKELAKALLDAIIVKAQVASTLRRHSAATPVPVAAASRTATARTKRQPSKAAA